MSKALRNYGQTRADVHHQMSENQVLNNTGGYVFDVSDKSRLERFLILGTDGGTFYVSEEDLTKQNVDWLIKLIQTDSKLVMDTILDISKNGRALKNSAAIFTLALVLNHGDVVYKQYAAALAPEVARTGTMVFELAQYLENLGGWGRAKRTAIANWFTTKTPDQLAYQAVKYRHRNGWTLRDLMRLSHPKGVHQGVGGFILKGETAWADVDILSGYNYMSKAKTVEGPNGVLGVLQAYPNLPWETIPTQFLKEDVVWKQLFYNNQLKGQALVRNIVRLEKIGAFKDTGFRNDVAAALADPDLIKKARIHPMNYLNASIVYSEGQIDRKNASWYSSSRNKTWTTTKMIEEALKSGFYESFGTVEPSGKRFMVGVDVSGSMSAYASTGADLTAAQASGAMAMVLARTEPDVQVYGFANSFRDLGIKPTDTWESIMKKITGHNFGSTNMSLPMRHAKTTRQDIDTFVVITDNEVNTGTQPSAALRDYRRTNVSDAKLAVMAVTATPFTIADPRDHGMLDVVGFDTNTPKVISTFAKGF
jgi:60 kDa SS-A/Ro ribonucleoprotein